MSHLTKTAFYPLMHFMWKHAPRTTLKHGVRFTCCRGSICFPGDSVYRVYEVRDLEPLHGQDLQETGKIIYLITSNNNKIIILLIK